MEAATSLKKNSISKGKLKKTMRNVLCRPDPVFWPAVSEKQGDLLLTALSEHKVHLPEFKKLQWKKLKLMPKDERPKPPKIEKVEGLLFGITECSLAIKSGECSAILIEATVNPRAIVQPILEACMKATLPVVSLNGLRKNSALYFGIPTSCLAILKEHFPDISNKILEMTKDKLPQTKLMDIEFQQNVKNEPMDAKVQKRNIEDLEMPEPTRNPDMKNIYLYRTSKKSRVFVPPSEMSVSKTKTEFKGQDFIEFSDESAIQNKKPFKTMIVKRVSNNPNRVKVK